MKPGIILCPRYDNQREMFCDWLILNGLDPKRIPKWSRIVVTGTRIIVTEFVMDQRRHGGKRVRVISNSHGFPNVATRKRAVRLRYDLRIPGLTDG